MLLAVTLVVVDPRFPVANAIKNVLLGAISLVASAIFVATGPVLWAAVTPLAGGLLIGSALGPIIVRHLPPNLVRWIAAAFGLVLAVYLWLHPGSPCWAGQIETIVCSLLAKDNVLISFFLGEENIVVRPRPQRATESPAAARMKQVDPEVRRPPSPAGVDRVWHQLALVLGVLGVFGTVSASAAPRSSLAVSLNSDRSNPTRLNSPTVQDEIYVFVRSKPGSRRSPSIWTTRDVRTTRTNRGVHPSTSRARPATDRRTRSIPRRSSTDHTRSPRS